MHTIYSNSIKLCAATLFLSAVVLYGYAQITPRRHKPVNPAVVSPQSGKGFLVPQMERRNEFRSTVVAHRMTLQDVADQLCELQDQVSALQDKVAADEQTIEAQAATIQTQLNDLQKLLPPLATDGSKVFQPVWTSIELPQSVDKSLLGVIRDLKVQRFYGWVYVNTRDPKAGEIHNLAG